MERLSGGALREGSVLIVEHVRYSFLDNDAQSSDEVTIFSR